MVVEEVFCVVADYRALPTQQIEGGGVVEEQCVCLDEVCSKDHLECGLL